jgi:hypothetical protein
MSDLDSVDEFLEGDREAVRQQTKQALPADSLPQDWNSSELEEVQRIHSGLTDYFSDYSLPNGIDLKESSRKGRYRGRDQMDRPVILAKNTRRIESTAHELGHDVFREVMPEMEGSELLISTLKEMFADLTALHFTDIEPDKRDLNRDPRKDMEPYEGVEKALDQEVRDDELREINAVENVLYQKGWNTVEKDSLLQVNAKRLLETGPELVETGEIQDHKDYSVMRARYWGKLGTENEWRDNMFIQNLLQDRTCPSITRLEQSKLDIWKMADVLGNQNLGSLGKPVLKAYESETPIGRKIRETAKKKFRHPEKKVLEANPEEVLRDTLARELERTRSLVRSYRETLREIDSRPEQVMEDISHLKYGSQSIDNGYPGFEENISYPHNVGGLIAEELYEEGVEPSELMESPSDYLKMGADRIRSEIARQV